MHERADRQGRPENWTLLRFSTRYLTAPLFSTRTLTSVAATLLTIASMATPAALGVSAAQNAQKLQDHRVAATEQLTESTGLHHDQLSIYPKLVKSRIDSTAARTLAQADAVVKHVRTKADVKPLVRLADRLRAYARLDVDSVQSLTAATTKAIATAEAAAAAHDRAAAAAHERAVAAQRAAANTPSGAKAVARELASSQHGWGDGEFQCLVNLWDKESGWNYQAYNSSSGAGGIPQALPASKMAAAGSDWASNAATQITWGLDYIARGYGTPCAAWSHSQAMNWY